MRNDPDEPLREQRRRERSRSQSYDNMPLPPLPEMRMNFDNDKLILSSTATFPEIDSGELNSDVRQELLSQFITNNSNRTRQQRWQPNNEPLHEERLSKDPLNNTSTRSSPDPINKS
jgi:hypothetical protein